MMEKLRRHTLTISRGTEQEAIVSKSRHSMDINWILENRTRSFPPSSTKDNLQPLLDSESTSRCTSLSNSIQKTDSNSDSDDCASKLESEKAVSVQEVCLEPPYHVFDRSKKKQMVYIVSLAALFSPLSSNIYFPAMDQISKDLGVSVSLISLTVTIYMIVQGIAPSFWGPLSDTKGRRVVFISTFIVYLISNVGLAFSNSFAMLMVFRGIQAAGSSATISIGAGVIGDITTSAERGSLIGVFGGIRMMGQSVGPVFGGLISQYLGFHAIFWFLFGLGAIALFLIILLLPETLRSIAGNGSEPLSGIYRPLLYTRDFGPSASQPQVKPPKRELTFKNVVSPLRFLFEKDVFVTLFFGSIVYTVWSMVTSTGSSLFVYYYNLNTWEVGLAFIPNGAGCVTGSIFTGYLMDWDYRRVETEYKLRKGIPEEAKLNKKELADFPIEQSRLCNIWWLILLFLATTAGYGFSVEKTHISIPLILQFFIAYAATAVFSLNSALVIDLYPGASASATAVNNLMRCSVGAIGVAFSQPLIDALSARWAFFMLAGITAASSPLVLVAWKFGPTWREERRVRLAKREAEKQADGEVEKGGASG